MPIPGSQSHTSHCSSWLFLELIMALGQNHNIWTLVYAWTRGSLINFKKRWTLNLLAREFYNIKIVNINEVDEPFPYLTQIELATWRSRNTTNLMDIEAYEYSNEVEI